MKQLRIFVGLLVALLAFATPSRACLWDSDTLAQEAAGLPGVVEALVGFYPQNPPRYYEMRLERVLPLIEMEPENLGHYDDASVAYDRLGKTDEAIAIMARKRAVLDAMPEDEPDRIEHEYRYLANLGTHYAHRWLATQDTEELSDLERARDLIAAAIELNPDAHFGREFVQLRVLEALWLWHSELPPFDEQREYEDVLGFLTEVEGKTAEQLLEGYIGLIALGQAAQSIDVHAAIGWVLAAERKATLTEMAELRIAELYRSGARSLFVPEPTHVGMYMRFFVGSSYDDVSLQTRQYFAYARLLAVEQDDYRAGFMRSQFESGAHPDTHTRFWEWYETRSLPPLPNGFLSLGFSANRVEMFVVLGGVLLVGLFIALYLFGRWRRRRKRQRERLAAAA